MPISPRTDFTPGLVSLCIPCYNIAPYFHRLRDSLVAQTYKHLQIILVNDGSQDNTLQVLQQAISQFEIEKYDCTLINQENKGQASAINAALAHVRGEFLVWPDADDWMTPDSIEQRVTFLREHPEAVLVRANMMKINEKNLEPLGTWDATSTPHPRLIENFLQKLIMNRDWCGAGAVMTRSSALMQLLPDKGIYATPRGGQNWQLLIPLATLGNCWQLPSVLNFYLVRSNSHSHAQKTLEEQTRYINTSEDVLLNTLKTLPAIEHIYRPKVLLRSEWERFNAARKHHHRPQMQRSYRRLVKLGIPFSLRIRAFLIAYITPFKGRLLYRKIRKTYNKC